MTKARSFARALGTAVVAVATTLPFATPAHADPVIPINWKVDATTTIKSLNQTVVVPTGTFDGGFDMGTGTLTGDLDLPQASKRLDIGALPLATVTFGMNQSSPVTGTLDLATMQADTTASFNIQLVSIRPLLTPWLNLVGNTCQTRTPVTSQLGGTVNLGGKSTFNGEFVIPKFGGCGLFVTPVINAIVPGPGNTISASFYQ